MTIFRPPPPPSPGVCSGFAVTWTCVCFALVFAPLGCPIGTEIKKYCIVIVTVIVIFSVAIHRVITTLQLLPYQRRAEHCSLLLKQMSNKPRGRPARWPWMKLPPPQTSHKFSSSPSRAVVFSTRIAIANSGITYTAPGGESAEWEGSVLGYKARVTVC